MVVSTLPPSAYNYLNPGGRAMTYETEAWISPMVLAIVARQRSGASFARVVDWAVHAGEVCNEDMDWLDVGQLMREELGWDTYPPVPLDIMN